LVESRIRGMPPSRLLYDGFGRRRRVHTPRGAILQYVHDLRGLLTEVAVHAPTPAGDPGGLLGRRRWERDERGRVRRQVEALFVAPGGPIQDVVTTFHLDEAGRPRRIDDPGGLRRQRAHNATGVLVEEQDALGNGVRWDLDAAGRVASMEVVERAASGAVVSATWRRTHDSRGQVRSET